MSKACHVSKSSYLIQCSYISIYLKKEKKKGSPGMGKARKGETKVEPGVRSTQKACVEVLGLRSEGATILVLSFLAAKEKGET